MRPLLLLLAACADDKGELADLLEPDPEPPCADGTWSGWTAAEGLVHVSTSGDDATADGSAEAPFATLGAALQSLRGKGGDQKVALGPGTFQTVRTLKQADAAGSLTVQGCSADETELLGVFESQTQSALAIEGPSAVALRRLRLVADGGGLVVRAGGRATLDELRVQDVQGFGVGVIGQDTTASLTDVEILSPGAARRWTLDGWGLLVTGASVQAERLKVQGARSMGVYVNGGSLKATGLVVDGVEDTGLGRRGFGVYARDASSITLSDCAVSRVAAAGVVLINVESSAITGCAVSDVTANSTGGGDGIVVTNQYGAEGPFVTTLTGNTVTRAARMGIAVSGVTATLSGNTAGADNGLVVEGSSVFADAGAAVSGDTTAPFDRDEQALLQAYARWGRPIGANEP